MATLILGLWAAGFCEGRVFVFVAGTVAGIGNVGNVGTTSSGKGGITSTGATSTGAASTGATSTGATSTGATDVAVLASLFSAVTLVDPGNTTLGKVGSVSVAKGGKVGSVSVATGGNVGTVSAGTTRDCDGTAMAEAVPVDPGSTTLGKVGVVSVATGGKVGVGKVALMGFWTASKAYALEPNPDVRNKIAIITFFITTLSIW